jgi:hypothetical protein
MERNTEKDGTGKDEYWFHTIENKKSPEKHKGRNP